MEEIKAKIIAAMEAYKVENSKIRLEALYSLYNEVFFFKAKEYGLGYKKPYKDFKKRCGGGCDTAVINSLRQFVDMPPLDEVPKQTYNERLSICKSCGYHKRYLNLVTCGTIYIGEQTDDGKLCGCIMQIKCGLSSAKCSLDIPKWI